MPATTDLDRTMMRESLRVLGSRRAQAVAGVEASSRELEHLIPRALEAGLSVSEIARLAGMTRQTVYAHWDRAAVG